MDSILILAEDSYYVAQYDAVLDCIVDIQQVPLADIVRIEFGQGWKSQRIQIHRLASILISYRFLRDNHKDMAKVLRLLVRRFFL
jgi:hypothetical protein